MKREQSTKKYCVTVKDNKGAMNVFNTDKEPVLDEQLLEITIGRNKTLYFNINNIISFGISERYIKEEATDNGEGN